MGLLLGGHVHSGLGTASTVITVSGETILHEVDNGNNARAGVQVNSSGNMFKHQGLTFTQIDTATDWKRPTDGSGTFHVRFTKGGVDPTPTVGTLNTWLALTSSQEVYYEVTQDDSTTSGTITVAILADGGTSTEDSGSYPITATVGLP